MIRRLIFAATLACLAFPTTSVAQQETSNDTVQLAFWKCEWSDFQSIPQMVDSVWTPIAQELVNEGKLIYFQLLRHNWSDEWNFVYYYRARDIASFLEAWGELVSRVQERHPDNFAWFTERCEEHKDGFYTSVTSTRTPS